MTGNVRISDKFDIKKAVLFIFNIDRIEKYINLQMVIIYEDFFNTL